MKYKIGQLQMPVQDRYKIGQLQMPAPSKVTNNYSYNKNLGKNEN